MSARAHAVLLTIVVVLLAFPVPAAAHRLDEYLQATRISVSVDRVMFEIDLTAGVEVAPKILALIDADRNGDISLAEGETYARAVLRSVTLEIDDQPRPVTLVKGQF